MELHERAIRFNRNNCETLEEFFPKKVIPKNLNIKDALTRLSRNPDPEIAKRALALITLGIEFGQSRMESKIVLDNRQAIFERYRDRLSLLREEVFLLLFFDNAATLISEILLTIGISSKTLYGTKDIFYYAIEQKATSIVLVHNHPSGKKYPSKKDILATHYLTQVGEFLGIAVADHMIITEDDFYSFEEQSQLHPGYRQPKICEYLFSP